MRRCCRRSNDRTPRHRRTSIPHTRSRTMSVTPVLPPAPRRAVTIAVASLVCSLLLLGRSPGLDKDLPGLKALTEFQDVFVDIAEHVKPAVVNISTGGTPAAPRPGGERFRQRPDSPSSGSGVIIDKEGYIATNRSEE